MKQRGVAEHNHLPMNEPTLLELLKNGVHFGHQTSKWHPRMKPFLFSSRNGIHIIDLEQSLGALKKAQTFVRDVAANGGSILFIGTKRQAKDIVRRSAEDAGQPFITERWLGGLFTNFATVGKVLERFRTLLADREAGSLGKYTKKERLKFDEELVKLEKLVGGVRLLEKLPQAVFVVDCKMEKTAVREAKKVGIPIVAMVDSNVDPEGIAYPIPANDDATKSIELITKHVAEAVKEGAAAFAEKQSAQAAQPAPPLGPAVSEVPASGKSRDVTPQP